MTQLVKYLAQLLVFEIALAVLTPLWITLIVGLFFLAIGYFQFYGDVHVYTMDGRFYDFQAVGVFWLVLSNPAIYQQLNTTGFAMQVELQPPSYSVAIGSPAALNYVGVTYMAAIGIQADGSCGIITVTPRANPRLPKVKRILTSSTQV